jgi:hypothetical protein
VPVQKSPITVGSRGAGEVWVDGGTVRAEGGLFHPQLMVPLTIAMNPQPSDAQIILTSVRAGLSLSDQPQHHNLACPPTSESLLDGFFVRSLESPSDHAIDLRFFLTHQEVAAIESRHRQHPSSMSSRPV